ncbi:MAG: NAD(P)-binding protein [Thermoleophilia bacterium]
MSEKYPHLFSPLQIGNVTVRNRIMQTAHVKLFTHRGVDSARNVAYQVERAKGGAGLLITGNRQVHPTSTTGMPRFSFAFLKEGVENDKRMTSLVHKHGATIFTQMNHFGLQATSDAADDIRVLWGPSAVKSPAYGETAKPMELEDIEELKQWWSDCAVTCRDCGFDGTEVHISHSYLLHSFLSPVYNKREDQYGGSFENRLRLTREVIAAIREKVGRDWVVGVRVTLSDFIPGGLTVGDAVKTARMLEDDGQIDYVNVSAAGYHNVHQAIQPSDAPDGYLTELAAEVKSASKLPVFTIGGISSPADAERLLAEGHADMVAMTRTQIADPEFANKAREGREDEIIRCIRGNQGCIGRVFKGQAINCTVNPSAGREQRFGMGSIVPAATPGNWVVVGAGPAGLKAAEQLARRGHSVTVLEKAEQVGGQINLILKTAGRAPFGRVTEDLERIVRKLGVEIRTGTEATAESVLAMGADGVLVATGALPSRTGFSIVNPLVDVLPGVDRENVLHGWDVLLGTKPVGQRVVVLDDDGNRASAGISEFLLDAGKDVEVVTRYNALFPYTLYGLDMSTVYGRVMSKGLTYRANEWAASFDGSSLTVFNLYTGGQSVLEGVDTLVLATQPKANDGLYFDLKGKQANLHRIGDCHAPRKIDHAIYEGFLAGREIWDPKERYIYEGELEEDWDAIRA